LLAVSLGEATFQNRRPLFTSHVAIATAIIAMRSTPMSAHCPASVRPLFFPAMSEGRAKKGPAGKRVSEDAPKIPTALAAGKPSALLDTRVVYCGDNLEQLAKLPDACVDLI
jgi:hypothetical protein